MYFLSSIIIIIFFLSSCTLKPVYSEKYYNYLSSHNELNAINVEPVRSVDGAEFYHRLVSILPQKAKAEYLLKTQFVNVSMPATIAKNSNILRESINQSVSYQLIDIKTNKILTSEKFYQTTSYNTIFSPYASDIEREETQIELARQAAEEIRTRLILYFAKNKQAS
ncbi:LPS assembly lipoprotein LptE [Rickettsia endosymbiont of Halotydeus destructor]|uniref:LPS assembly lipoprotein LptE n=1 Tax=Rickettsia endosymbiont of Halotydeus destructor TaxID=2996754 RepID=UPI003BB0C197